MSREQNLMIHTDDSSLFDFPEINMFGDVRHMSAERTLPPHFNVGVEICLCRTGVYRWIVEGSPVELRPGELSITRPSQRHSGRNNILGPGRLSWIILQPAPDGRLISNSLEQVIGADSDPIQRTISSSDDVYLGIIPDAAHAFERLRSELEGSRVGRTAAVRSELVWLMVEVARSLSEVSPPRRVAEPVPEGVVTLLHDVADAPDRAWTTAEMAARSGLGITAFTDWCRRMTGLSPRWYLIERRLERSREMLTKSDEPITDIALDSGFNSSQHFASTFRKLYGQSPSDYRRESAAGPGTTGRK